jgi:hypothetical protein
MREMEMAPEGRFEYGAQSVQIISGVLARKVPIATIVVMAWREQMILKLEEVSETCANP